VIIAVPAKLESKKESDPPAEFVIMAFPAEAESPNEMLPVLRMTALAALLLSRNYR